MKFYHRPPTSMTNELILATSELGTNIIEASPDGSVTTKYMLQPTTDLEGLTEITAKEYAHHTTEMIERTNELRIAIVMCTTEAIMLSH